MKRITIIGGGASGTLLAINLLRHADEKPLKIDLVEKRERLGLGVAYSTDKDTNLLNVPANRMGAFPDDVEHFHRWLETNGFQFDPVAFIPRKIFGAYLKSLLNETTDSLPVGCEFTAYDDEAVDISSGSEETSVQLRSGTTLHSDKVVLAFGNFLPPDPSVEDLSFTTSPRYFRDSWDSAIYERIRPEESVFIVGTGLSMVDVVLHLNKIGHTGKIDAISTRGLLPAVHRLGFTYPSFHDELAEMTKVTDLLKTVRRHIAIAEADSSDWRAVIDSLRPQTQEIWLRLTTEEKRYFMQHLSRYWNVARHRMPPEAAEIVDELQRHGQLSVLKGRLRRIENNGEGRFKIAYNSNGSHFTDTADVLINCIGSESNFTRIDTPLVQNLLRKGYIQPDEVQFGLKATPDGNIIDRKNETSNVFHTLGTALKGTLWETTAIPEIRAQARKLALKLLYD